MFRFLNTIFVSLSVFLIRVYQVTLSPDKGLFSRFLRGRICAHHPHCSAYTIGALRRFGFWRGRERALSRIGRCRPSSSSTYDPVAPRVVFFSSAPIGIPFLKYLFGDSRFDLVGVVTMPDAPVGRGQKIQPNIIKTTAHTLSPSLPVLTPSRLHPDKSDEGKQFFGQLQVLKADYFVVIAYGKILPQPILDLPAIAPINVHGSLLPAYRGASPLQSVFLDDVKETGITIMKMTAGCDEGPIYDTLETSLPFHRTVIDLIDRIGKKGPAFLNTTLEKIAQQQLKPRDQDEDKISISSKISKEDGEINPFSESIQSIYTKTRAFALRPKTYFFLDNQRIIVEKLILDENLFAKHAQDPLLNKDFSLNPCVLTLRIKPENKSERDRKDFSHTLSPKNNAIKPSS